MGISHRLDFATKSFSLSIQHHQTTKMTKYEFEVVMTCASCDMTKCTNAITDKLAKEKAAGQIDDFGVKLADKKVCVASCKLSQDQVAEIVKNSCCGKDVKFVGTCSHASKPCTH